MPRFASERRVRHAAIDMFDLVADVARYPEFVPLCEKLVVRGKSREEGREVLIADMTVGYKAFRETVTTRVVTDRAALVIAISYLNGPFRHLDGQWTFVADASGSTVKFAVDYEFRSRVLAALMGAMFEQAFRRFAAAFEARADAIYGAGGRLTPAT
jgi:coenzyme Q-binding protein COQ10